MKIIDLTHTVTDNMPVYPGDPFSSLKQTAFVEKNGYTDHELKTGMHVGTHIDAPLHMIADGKKINEISPEKFVGNGVLIDASHMTKIDEALLQNQVIKSDSIVLIYTGFGNKYNDPNYFENSPIITENFAQQLVQSKIKLIGMDMSGPDRPPFPVHKIFLKNNTPIIENLTNLDKLIGIKNFEVIALPAKFNSDGAPGRVIAKI